MTAELCQVPDSPPSLITSPALSWRGKLRLLMEPIASGTAGPPKRQCTSSPTRRIGHEAAEMLVDAAVGISAGDSRELSVSAQFPMMTEMEATTAA